MFWSGLFVAVRLSRLFGCRRLGFQISFKYLEPVEGEGPAFSDSDVFKGPTCFEGKIQSRTVALVLAWR